MKIRKYLPVLLSIAMLLFLIGCQAQENPAPPAQEQDNISNMGQVYAVALDAFMELEAFLNDDMAYIAVDTEGMVGANAEDLRFVLEHMEAYGVPVMEMTFQELTDQGYFDQNTYSLEGIFLSIMEVEQLSPTEIFIKGWKFREGMELIGVQIKVVFDHNRWNVVESGLFFV